MIADRDHEIFVDLGRLLITPEALISILVVASFIKWGGHFFASSPKISDLTAGLIAYASIALAACGQIRAGN